MSKHEVTIATGITDGSAASHLVLVYLKNRTKVITVGEANNAEPTFVAGHLDPEEAKRRYLADITED